MADRDEPQPESADTRPEDIRWRLDGVASGIDIGELEQARPKVDGVVGRRRARKRIGATLRAAAVIALVATTAVLTIGGDEPDTLVTSDDTMAPDTVPDDSVDDPEPTLDLSVATAQPVELIDGAARPGSVAGANGAPEYGEWIVPWDDGFLAGSISFLPQPLPDELPEDVIALFPQEVIDLFDGDLPDTIAEAIEQISEAGLLDVVSEIQLEIDAGNGFGMSTDDIGITVEYDYESDGNNPARTRTFTWDGEPAPTDAPPVGGPIAATSKGFVQWTDQTWLSPDGVTWTASPLPDDVSWVSGAFNIEGGVMILSSTPTGETRVHRVDERGENAVLLDLPVPITGALSPIAPFGGSATSGTVVSVDPLVAPEDRFSVEADGYRLSIQQPGGIFEVTEVATGEVVVSESLVRPSADGGSLTIDDAGITVTDPATGDVLVVFSNELLDAAQSENFDEGGGEYHADFWLLASLDGQRFVIDDIDDATDGPTSLATNGTRLLLQSGTNWILYDLA